jgi:hypothetical protein
MSYPILLSVILVLRNSAITVESVLTDISTSLVKLVGDYELIIVDNASEDDSIAVLKKLSGEGGLSNLTVYALTKEVDSDTASWVGLENALGDFVTVIDPATDSIDFLPNLLECALEGADVVFASNQQKPKQSWSYRVCYSVFNLIYHGSNGIDLANDAPSYRVLSKRVVNFILQHPMPSLTFRHLPATGGFTKVNLKYSAKTRTLHAKRLGESIDRGMRLLVSTTRAPMRLVTTLSLFGAGANLLYSFYVIAVALLKADVAPGWVTLSLQQSGMFLLISLVLWIMGEYVLHMAGLANAGPMYHVAQEFTSAVMTRREKLNIEEFMPKSPESAIQPKRIV